MTWVECRECQGDGGYHDPVAVDQFYSCPHCEGDGGREEAYWVTCQTCDGAGETATECPCVDCNGEGGGLGVPEEPMRTAPHEVAPGVYEWRKVAALPINEEHDALVEGLVKAQIPHVRKPMLTEAESALIKALRDAKVELDERPCDSLTFSEEVHTDFDKNTNSKTVTITLKYYA